MMRYKKQEEYICPICKTKGKIQVNYTPDYTYIFCNSCHLEFTSGVVDEVYANAHRLSEKAFLNNFYKHHFNEYLKRGE